MGKKSKTKNLRGNRLQKARDFVFNLTTDNPIRFSDEPKQRFKKNEIPKDYIFEAV